MPVLVVKFKDKKVRDYPIVLGQKYTIGRKESNDIVIDNLSVSGLHAQLEPVATVFVLRDMESTNGTFVNERRVSTHNLRHGDLILIGKHTLYFDRSDLKRKAQTATDIYNDDKTRILDTTKYRDLMQHSLENSAGSHHASDPHKGSGQKKSFWGRMLEMLFG